MPLREAALGCEEVVSMMKKRKVRARREGEVKRRGRCAKEGGGRTCWGRGERDQYGVHHSKLYSHLCSINNAIRTRAATSSRS